MPKLSLETLNEERLRKSVDPAIYQRGQALYQAGRVQITELREDSASCLLNDRHPYRIEIKVANNFLYLKCDCRFAYRGLICEHDIAACLAVRDVLQQRLPPTWRNQINRILDTSSTSPKKPASNPFLLFFSLYPAELGGGNWKIAPYYLPSSSLKKLIQEFPDLLDKSTLEDKVESSPELSSQVRTPYQLLKPENCLNANTQSVILANIIIERSRNFVFSSSGFPLDEYLTLIAEARSPLFRSDGHNPIKSKLQVRSEPVSLALSLNRVSNGIQIQGRLAIPETSLVVPVQEKQPVEIIEPASGWVLISNALLKLSNLEQIDILESLLVSASVQIPSRDEALFQKKYLLPLAQKIDLDGDLLERRIVQVEPKKRVYLQETEAGIEAELRFAYNEYEVPFDPRYPNETILQEQDTWTLIRVIRKPEIEQTAFEDLTTASYGLKRRPNAPTPGLLSLRARVHPVDFLLNHVPRLIERGYEVFGEEQLKTARVNRNTPTISFQVSSGIDWFDVKAIVNFGEIEVSIKEIRRAFRKKDRFIKLADGSLGAIPEEWTDQYRHLFNLGNEIEDGVRLPKYHIGLIDQALTVTAEKSFDDTYATYHQKLLGFTGISSPALPTGFTGELRAYQKAGYDWLHFLREYQFGGCLADDMGLGKTVQVLAYLQSLKELNQRTMPGSRTSLIVVPRSLLVNWEREAARFTPGLKILEYFNPGRDKDFSQFNEADLVITTYGIMLRDIDLLGKYHFNYILLDESQAIKNPLSQTARATRLLNGDHRLVLTGTPVENSAQELWSQFAFLNPGLLGSLEFFKNEFVLPIEKKADEKAAQALRRIVYPFILRRTKDQVAPELPPRTERILYCDMEPAQRKIYTRTRDYYRGMILGMLEKEGLNQSRFRILEGLLRLRQISNHPRLVDEKFRGESGKFELLIETIETLQAEHHKALIFSQFVQMLRVVRETMDERQIPYTYLDGHTRNRMELVDEFQNNPHIPFFLISLKAGGQGLNLTAADYVIHIDPWWNPAVEMQASDRSHRIGQEKPVFIFKLITKDSVEEKILQLQGQKKMLVEQIITTDSSFFKSLTAEDVQELFS